MCSTLLAAILVSAATVIFFDLALLPLGAAVGTLIFCGGMKFSQVRVERHFDEIAWSNVKKIREFIDDATFDARNRNNIAEEQVVLGEKRFDHRAEEWRGIVTELNQKYYEHLNPTDFTDVKNAAATYMAGVMQRLAPHKPVPPLKSQLRAAAAAAATGLSELSCWGSNFCNRSKSDSRRNCSSPAGAGTPKP